MGRGARDEFWVDKGWSLIDENGHKIDSFPETNKQLINSSSNSETPENTQATQNIYNKPQTHTPNRYRCSGYNQLIKVSTTSIQCNAHQKLSHTHSVIAYKCVCKHPKEHREFFTNSNLSLLPTYITVTDKILLENRIVYHTLSSITPKIDKSQRIPQEERRKNSSELEFCRALRCRVLRSALKSDLIRESDMIRVCFRWVLGGHKVFLAGSFSHWKQLHPMHMKSKSNTKRITQSNHDTWELLLDLIPGFYQYVFFVDGKWRTDPSRNIINEKSSGIPSHPLYAFKTTNKLNTIQQQQPLMSM